MRRELDMEDVVRLLCLDYPTGRDSVNVICPVCGRKKLNINYRIGAYNCPACGEFSGGVLDMWAYHRNIESEDKKAIARDIYEFMDSGKALESSYVKKDIRKLREFEPAETKCIDRVYNAFLSLFSLSESAYKDLKRRGLSDDAIERNGYKTFPKIDISLYVSKLLEMGHVLEGVPGFYKNDGNWTFRNLGSGYLIPTRNQDGLIQGMQLRSDRKDVSCRYLTVSSAGLECGTRGRALPHVSYGISDSMSVVLTEGPLKADIISELTGRTAIGVLGVNSISEIPGVLKSLSPDEILIAYDMDRFEKKNVLSAQSKLKDILHESKTPYRELIWDASFKGLDDYLLSKKRNT